MILSNCNVYSRLILHDSFRLETLWCSIYLSHNGSKEHLFGEEYRRETRNGVIGHMWEKGYGRVSEFDEKKQSTARPLVPLDPNPAGQSVWRMWGNRKRERGCKSVCGAAASRRGWDSLLTLWPHCVKSLICQRAVKSSWRRRRGPKDELSRTRKENDYRIVHESQCDKKIPREEYRAYADKTKFKWLIDNLVND
jgi:hypothetical protein